MRERGQIRSESSPLAALRRSCLTLMSERGEANSVKFAQTAVSQYRALGKEGRTAFVTFNNPERHNAMSLEMWEATVHHLN